MYMSIAAFHRPCRVSISAAVSTEIDPCVSRRFIQRTHAPSDERTRCSHTNQATATRPIHLAPCVADKCGLLWPPARRKQPATHTTIHATYTHTHTHVVQYPPSLQQDWALETRDRCTNGFNPRFPEVNSNPTVGQVATPTVPPARIRRRRCRRISSQAN